MQNEIDLLKYFSLVGTLIKNNFKALIVLLILSGIVATGLYWWVPRKFETQMVASSKYLKPEVLEVAMAALNRATEEDNYTLIADYLKLDIKQASNLISISLHDVRPTMFTPGREDKSEYEKVYYFEIKLQTRTPENYDAIQQAIMTYLEGNQFVQTRKQIYEQISRTQLEKLNRDIDNLRELRRQEFTSSKSGDLIMVPPELNETLIEMSKEARELEIELNLFHPVQIIQGFIRYDKPVFPKKLHAAIGVFLLWVIFSGLYLSIKK